MAAIRIGTSGWSYRSWRGPFYPDDLPRRRELEFAAASLDSIELNGTFYSLTRAGTCRRWRDEAPADFVYAVKGSRFITHNKKLGDTGAALANFFASGVLELDEKLGPFLWQLPDSYLVAPDRLEEFLSRLPSDTTRARQMAKGHDERVSDPGFGDGEERRIRHVIELRHPQSLTPETVSLLRAKGVALAFSHSRRWPYVEELTADFVYLRLHGPGDLYDSPYGVSGLEDWAGRIRHWHRGGEPADARRLTDLPPPSRTARDVYVYFDNDGHAYAPREAMQLRRILGATSV